MIARTRPHTLRAEPHREVRGDERRPASASGDRLRRTAEHWIGRHPRWSVGAGLVLGVTLGWMIKRR